jgi:CheY-like chemotaxis protein
MVSEPTQTILLAEDEPAIREVLSRGLAGAGYRVFGQVIQGSTHAGSQCG